MGNLFLFEEPAEFASVLRDLNDLAPTCLPAFVDAAASTGERARAMASALDELGASDAAEAIRNFWQNVSATRRPVRSTTRQADRRH